MRLGQAFDLFQGPAHGAAAHFGAIEGFEYRFGLRLDPGQHVAKLAKLGFNCAQHLPDLAGTLFQRQGAKAHLQGTEHGQERRRPGERDAVLTLQRLHQAGAAQHFGVQAFGGQKQNRKVGGVRRLHVFLGDRLGLQADAQFQRLARFRRVGGVRPALGVEQAFVVFVGELGVNRQPQRRAVVRLARQLDGEVHHVFAARPGGHLSGVLLADKHLFQE